MRVHTIPEAVKERCIKRVLAGERAAAVAASEKVKYVRNIYKWIADSRGGIGMRNKPVRTDKFRRTTHIQKPKFTEFVRTESDLIKITRGDVTMHVHPSMLKEVLEVLK